MREQLKKATRFHGSPLCLLLSLLNEGKLFLGALACELSDSVGGGHDDNDDHKHAEHTDAHPFEIVNEVH